MTDAPGTLTFSTVAREPSLSDKVTRTILDSIVSGRFPVGARLPSERDLADQFGVSRTVIREAVRSLQAKGVLEVRSGRGLQVAAVDAAQLSETMRLFLAGAQGLDAGYAEIAEVRQTLEVRIAELACTEATDADLAAMERELLAMEESLGDLQGASQADVRFHRAMADATHNRLYGVLLDSIGEILLDIRIATLGNPGRPAQALQHHREIFERIRDRDPAGARRAMEEHLNESHDLWRGREA